MSDIEDRLTNIEQRLQRLELTGVRPVDPLPSTQPFAASSTAKNLLFWLALIILGIVIWELSNKLAQ
jgi:hypothetical protein